jgi:hypothetical protein
MAAPYQVRAVDLNNGASSACAARAQSRARLVAARGGIKSGAATGTIDPVATAAVGAGALTRQ